MVLLLYLRKYKNKMLYLRKCVVTCFVVKGVAVRCSCILILRPLLGTFLFVPFVSVANRLAKLSPNRVTISKNAPGSQSWLLVNTGNSEFCDTFLIKSKISKVLWLIVNHLWYALSDTFFVIFCLFLFLVCFRGSWIDFALTRFT